MQTKNCHSSFRFLRSEVIESLNIEMAEYEHQQTGARHYHIAADNEENVFLVAFRTVPMDSTGVAHMLEHTALCGSKRYPVRDPFFMMTRRSLNTFMNAFTSSDWTAYPFASQNRKDYFNLLDVYLDATFFSRLDPLDFAQEGHRMEFSEIGNPDSPLVYKGVVLNEMKGAMSSAVSTLYQTLGKHLFPTTTYHYNSGGDPECITDLSYDELLEFYRTHYHPSNAVFMTFGNIPAQELQSRFDAQALAQFERLDSHIRVTDEKRLYAPIRVEEAYALDEEDLSGKTHHVLGWLLGHSIDLEAQLRAHLLSRVLLDNSASPLRHALESSELGSAPSPLCGLEDSNRQMSFMCGLEGSDPQHAEAFEKLVLDTLNTVAENGVPQEMLEAQLHQLELSQRELSGDGYPYGLNLIMSSISAGIHNGDPIAVLNLDPVLEKLREDIKQPDFIQTMVRELLLDNAHQVRLTLRPDQHLASRREAAEAAQLEAIRVSLSDSEKEQLIAQTAALEARQMQEDDESMLPKVGISDVPAQMKIPQPQAQVQQPQALVSYAQGTNGLVYQQLIIDMPVLDAQERRLLPLFTHCLTELGCGERDYKQNQQYQSQVCGSIGAYTEVRGAVDNEQQVSGFLVLSGKALASKQQELADLMHETLQDARFDELKRLREIVAQTRTRKEQSITGQGHSLAMAAAVARMSPSAQLGHESSGLESIRFIKELDASLKDDGALAQLAAQMEAIKQKFLHAPRRFLLVGDADQLESMQGQIESCWKDVAVQPEFSAFALEPVRESVRQLWTTSTQVNFCAKAYPTVPVEHEDAAALTVLGDFLRNGYLHRAIREKGGAYGSGAGQDSSNGVFRFFSYRDPRLAETLADFDASVRWLLDTPQDPQKLEEAILGVVSSIDKPGSPAGEAKQAYHSALFGRTPEQRRDFRQRILAVTLEDLTRVAERYLTGDNASIAVVTNPAGAAKMGDDYEIIAI
ncbi:insulinase family protein [Marinobacterium rhizophilum]|uniref:insulinase family protein n=1 Tax=Marinobacterium rhizophilum TaxID=420402 RepID=UPI0003A0E45D|nr:insulinase family protein [Marinobacterium rhizophilum]